MIRVAAVAGVPTATLNLIDENRQCQLTTVGFEGADSPRDESMCAVVFESGKFTHVPDAREDPLFATNPWVTGILADVRHYASAPLVSPSGPDGPRHRPGDLPADRRAARRPHLGQRVAGRRRYDQLRDPS